MAKKREIYLRIDNLKCDVEKCGSQFKGFTFLPDPNDILPEVFCGNCGGRIEAQFSIEHEQIK